MQLELNIWMYVNTVYIQFMRVLSITTLFLYSHIYSRDRFMIQGHSLRAVAMPYYYDLLSYAVCIYKPDILGRFVSKSNGVIASALTIV